MDSGLALRPGGSFSPGRAARPRCYRAASRRAAGCETMSSLPPMVTAAPVRARLAAMGASWRLERTDVRWMVGLSLLALALRLWFVLSVGSPSTSTFNDPGVYHAMA